MQTDLLPRTETPSQTARLYLFALLALCAVVFFYGLGRLPLVGPDEPRYAEVAREMFESGDWITPRLGGIHWFEKPALTYWLSAIGFRLFGVSEFGARFGIALFASVGVLLLYWFARQVRGARYAYLSAAVLVTCGMWPGFARGATFDLPLSVALSLALLSFYLWDLSLTTGETWAANAAARPNLRHVYWWVFCFALGLAVLAKGLVGIVLPAAIIAPYLLLTRSWRASWQLLWRPKLLLLGAALFFVTAAIWYGPMLARHGREFINDFFIAHHFQRYLSNKFRHPQPFYFFPLVAFAGSFPWSFYLVHSVWCAARDWRATLTDRWRVFLWLWLLVPVLFFSFSGSKLPGYILPIFPALALLIGLELVRWWEDSTPPQQARLVAAVTGVFMLAVGAAAGIVGQRELGLAQNAAWTMAGIAIAVAVIYLLVLMLRGGRAAVLVLPFTALVIVIAAAHLVFPGLGRRESLRELSLTAVQVALPGERLVFYVNQDHGINFYATGLPLRDTKSELVALTSAQEVGLLAQASRSQSLLVISPKRWSDALTENPQLQTEQLGEQNFNARCSPGCDWVLLRVRRKS